MLIEQFAREQEAGRGRDGDFVFTTRIGTPLQQYNVADRGVEVAATEAGLGHVSPHDLRRSFCAPLAARRGVDPVAAAELTGHSLAVWASSYARSFGKSQRDEARAKMLGHGFGVVADEGDARVSAVSADPRRTGSPAVDSAQGEPLNHADSSSEVDRRRPTRRLHTREVPGSIPGAPMVKGAGHSALSMPAAAESARTAACLQSGCKARQRKDRA